MFATETRYNSNRGMETHTCVGEVRAEEEKEAIEAVKCHRKVWLQCRNIYSKTSTPMFQQQYCCYQCEVLRGRDQTASLGCDDYPDAELGR